MANKSSFALKLIVVVAIVIAAGVIGMFLLRPVAKVAVVAKGPAINAVPGNIVVQSETPPQDLKSEVGGRIVTINLDAGKKVKKGDLLVQLDTGDIELTIDRLKKEREAKKKLLEVGSAIALELATASSGLEVDERKAARNEIAPKDIENRRRVKAAIQQRLDAEKITNQLVLDQFDSSIKQNERQKDKMTISAPFDGVVTAVYASEGALIGANEKIATLITNARTVQAKISEENFVGIAPGQKASVTFLGGVGGRNAANVYNATISKILPTADPETQRYLVDLDVDDIKPEDLIPGKTGEVTITVGQREARAVVPRRALMGNRLYVVKDGRIEIRAVKPGYVWLKGVEILEGIAAGETVLLEQQDQFRNGDRVRAEVDATASAYEKPAVAEAARPAPPAGK